MEKIIEKIGRIVSDYDSGKWESADNLRRLLRELSSAHYYLTGFDIELAEQWNGVVYNHEGSDASGQRLADVMVPGKRKCRKLLLAISKVLDSMRSEMSYLKTN
jgi:hypothetical protein